MEKMFCTDGDKADLQEIPDNKKQLHFTFGQWKCRLGCDHLLVVTKTRQNTIVMWH